MFVPRVFRIRLLMNMPCIYANGLNDYVNTVALRFIGKCVSLVLLSMSYQSQHKITLLVINQNLRQASCVKAWCSTKTSALKIRWLSATPRPLSSGSGGRFYDAAGRDAFPKKQLKRKIKWKKHTRESAKAIPLSCSAGRRPVGWKNPPSCLHLPSSSPDFILQAKWRAGTCSGRKASLRRFFHGNLTELIFCWL